MIKKLFLLSAFCSLLLIFNSYSEKTNLPTSPIDSSSLQDSIITIRKNTPIALVGDLQRTTAWELMIGREQNDIERKEIINDVASEEPAALILLGDMVSYGSDANEWIYLKNLLKPVLDKNVPIVPVLGNHEYWGDDSTALYDAGKVFPVFQNKHWYIKRYGDIVFIILDSNRDDLSENTWSDQSKWFEGKLKYYDSDPSVKGIVVCLHHPPYTNSKVTGDNFNVQEAFVQPFFNSQKSMAMITGHSHTYERFFKKGKMFIISGGGGGPRVHLKTGPNIHRDLINLPSLRPFNYLLLYPEPDGIKIITKALNKGSSQFYTLEDFSIHFNSVVNY